MASNLTGCEAVLGAADMHLMCGASVDRELQKGTAYSGAG